MSGEFLPHPDSIVCPLDANEREAIAALEQGLWGNETPILDDVKRALPDEAEWGVPGSETH